MKLNRLAWSLGLVFAASTGFAQMYTLTDLGTLGGSWSQAAAINAWGQVAGSSGISGDTAGHAFRTARNRPINPLTDDLGTLIGTNSAATAINAWGQVVGSSYSLADPHAPRAFRTAPNRPINPATDDLGTLGSNFALAAGINIFGQAVGTSALGGIAYIHAFRTAHNRAINPATDDLGTLGNPDSHATGINFFGQVVGYSINSSGAHYHAFRAAPNRPINPATDDLGTLGGTDSSAAAINDFGQVAGWSTNSGGYTHAFRTAANSVINPATDDLGILGGSLSQAAGLDDYGQVVGFASTNGDNAQHAFLYSGTVMRDLNDLIASDSECELTGAVGMNDDGEISANGTCGGQQHAVLLTPIYKALISPPIAGGTVRFKLLRNNLRTCALPPATIAVSRATLSGFVPVDSAGDTVAQASCQYVSDLSASGLGRGIYRVDISIAGIMVGHAVFTLR